MKKCELCKIAARTFCESDQASLCWDCDAKVHGANFLVARHVRTLLCHTCHSLTPWKASGSSLGNTVSLCQVCAGGTTRVHHHDHDHDDVEESEGDNEDEIETSFEEQEDLEDDDEDNQVVPWSSTATAAPPAVSSSGSEGSVTMCSHEDDDEDVAESATTSVSLKRRRQDHDLQEGSKRRYVNGGDLKEQVDLLACVLKCVAGYRRG